MHTRRSTRPHRQCHVGSTAGQEAVRTSQCARDQHRPVMTNLGDSRNARRWWRSAARAADESGDHYAAALVLGRQAVFSLYEARPTPSILNTAEEAIAVASSKPCAGVASGYAAKAQVLAHLGRHDEAVTALHDQRADRTDLRIRATRHIPLVGRTYYRGTRGIRRRDRRSYLCPQRTDGRSGVAGQARRACPPRRTGRVGLGLVMALVEPGPTIDAAVAPSTTACSRRQDASYRPEPRPSARPASMP